MAVFFSAAPSPLPAHWSTMIRIRFLPSLLTALALLAAVPLASARDMVSVNRNEINMRSGAGTHHEALWVLSRGYPLEVLAKKGKWIQVRDFENDRGWVYKPLTSTRAPHHVVKVQVLNIRSKPSLRSKVLAKAAHGEILKTLGRKGDWVKVQQDGGLIGWVARRLVWGW